MIGTLPFTMVAHMSICIVTMSRLLVLEDPAWDLALARRSFDLAVVTQRLEERFQAADWAEVAQAAVRKRKYMDNDRTMTATYRDKLRWIRNWYLTKLPALEGSTLAVPAERDPATSITSTGHDQDPPAESSGSEFDTAFWESLLNLGESTWGITRTGF
jgi:hypothetical protein